MPKINLLNRKKQKIRQRLSGEGTVYLIKTHRNSKTYYVCKVDPTSKAITWTTSKENAMTFHTEAGTQQFVHSYMKHRKDIELVGTRSVHA